MKYLLLFPVIVFVLNSNTIHYEAVQPAELITGKITAYTSDPLETDSTPTITASGTRTREGVVANNCLAFGTEVIIASKTYIVEDRMNSRYGCEHYDVWMEDKGDALEWGIKELAVELTRK